VKVFFLLVLVQLKKQLENNSIDDVEKQEVINNMDILKKKFIHIGKNEVDSVKRRGPEWEVGEYFRASQANRGKSFA
jgi:hypothetical protein